MLFFFISWYPNVSNLILHGSTMSLCPTASGAGVLVLAISSSEVKKEDPTSKMLLSAEAQEEREVETRLRSVKLLEQCVMIAKRTVDIRTWEHLRSLHFLYETTAIYCLMGVWIPLNTYENILY